MPQLRSKGELARLAEAFVLRFSLVRHKGVLFMPVHFMTRLPSSGLTPDTTVWLPLYDEEIMVMANDISDILFVSDGDFRSYKLMLRQFSTLVPSSNGILVRRGTDRVEQLKEDGTLAPATGDFVPNYLNVPYEGHTPLVDELFKVVCEWVGGEDNAHSLLYHIATALQPGWSAVRYVILIGSGRNGKSTLLKMVRKLFGSDNVSAVTRQMMSASSTVITSLNNKLLNIVMDGPKQFLKDSSTEKTLIAGEPLDIELKYENAPFTVQTNALFMEGLQHEPQVSDKSSALQKRLVRFRFPNEYPLNLDYEAEKLKEESLAAFLHLLLIHWVNKKEVATKLQVTADSLDLQMQAVWVMSPVLRFLEFAASRNKDFLDEILNQKMIVDVFIAAYRPWLESNGYRNMEDSYILQQLDDHFITDRKSFRINKKPTTKRYIKSVQPDTRNAINTLLQGGSLEKNIEEQDVLSD